MGRKRTQGREDLPKGVYRKGGRYIYREYLGIESGKPKFGKDISLCQFGAPIERVKTELLKLKNKRATDKRSKHLKKSLAYQQRNPGKVSARLDVAKAIYRGDLVRGPCEVCGEEKTHGHHDDYSKPLSVRWLCPKHHTEWHAIHGPGLNAPVGEIDQQAIPDTYRIEFKNTRHRCRSECHRCKYATYTPGMWCQEMETEPVGICERFLRIKRATRGTG